MQMTIASALENLIGEKRTAKIRSTKISSIAKAIIGEDKYHSVKASLAAEHLEIIVPGKIGATYTHGGHPIHSRPLGELKFWTPRQKEECLAQMERNKAERLE